MKVTIGEKELEVNSIATLGKAMMYLLEGFATALTGTKEELKAELKEEVKQKVYSEILEPLSDTPVDTIGKLMNWLDDMHRIELVGCSESEIKDKAVEDALIYTDFSSIDDMMETLERYRDALEAIRHEVDEVI